LTELRLQSQPPDKALRYTGPWDCFKQTWSKEGVRGLYRVSLLTVLLRNLELVEVVKSWSSPILLSSPSLPSFRFLFAPFLHPFDKVLLTFALLGLLAPTDSVYVRIRSIQGLSAPIVGAAAENACLFLVYNQCQRLITFARGSDPNTPPEDKGLDELALAAAGAGAVASFILFVSSFSSISYLASFARCRAFFP